MNNKKLKVAFYILLASMVLLITSSLCTRFFDFNHMNANLYKGFYYTAVGSLYLSMAALVFLIYFLFKQKLRNKR